MTSRANALRVIFFFLGASWASWVVRIPSLRDRLALGTASLGFALSGAAIGALVAMPIAALVVERVPPRRILRPLLAVHAACLPVAALAPDVTSLFVAAVALGLGRGAIIAALNAEGAELERASGRRILGSFHALYSLGSLTGAGVGGVIAERGVGPVLHLGLAAAIVALAVVVLRDGPAREPDLRPAPVRPEGEPGRGRLAPVALIAFVALFGQSACGDWSAIFLRDVAHVSPGVAAAGYGAYALSMIVVRLVGDRIAGAIGEVRVVRYGAALAGTGIMLALALPGARAVTTAGAAGFLGSLVGPLVIGASAAALGVRVALGWVVVSSVVLAVLAPAVRRAHAWL